MFHSITAELTHSSPQVHSEYPDFHFDPRLEVKLCFALGDSYHNMGRYKEAKEMVERACRVCKEENLKETKEGARVAVLLGLTYQ